MYEHSLTVVRAALLCLATVLIFIPETRDTRMTAALFLLFGLAACASVWKFHRQGVLRLTPKQVYQLPKKPNANVLEVAALVMAVVAMTVTSL